MCVGGGNKYLSVMLHIARFIVCKSEREDLSVHKSDAGFLNNLHSNVLFKCTSSYWGLAVLRACCAHTVYKHTPANIWIYTTAPEKGLPHSIFKV